MNNVHYELYHYGVKGMKWGVRRNRTLNSSIGPRKRGFKAGVHSVVNNDKIRKGAQVTGQVLFGTAIGAMTVSALLGAIPAAAGVSAIVTPIASNIVTVQRTYAAGEFACKLAMKKIGQQTIDKI